MKTALAGAILFWLVLIGVPALAAETLTLYDNFNTSPINPGKWTGTVSDVLEAYRAIVFPVAGDGELRLDARGYGFRANSFMPGIPSQGRGSTNRLKFRRFTEDTIRAIRATVKVNSTSAVGCPTAGSDYTQARFRMNGVFFNAGTGEPNRATDDVFARVEIRRYARNPTYPAANQLEVRALVRRCVDVDCVLDQTLFSQVLGTILLGETHSLLLQWDPAANQFIFQLDAIPPLTYTYTLPDSAPPQGNTDKKHIGINHWLPNCGPAQTQAFMSVNVDDVYINTGALAAPAEMSPDLAILQDAGEEGTEIGLADR
jgi:hypothetical protein